MKRNREHGFALVAAIFLMVVLAGLGAFAVRTAMSQQFATNLDLDSARAEAAVQAGMEYAALRLTPPNGCASLSAPFGVADGFTVRIDNCVQQNPAPIVNGVALSVFTVDITAFRGVYGTPEFVSRTKSARIAP
jgi:MSHA biogenesis protein MshP